MILGSHKILLNEIGDIVVYLGRTIQHNYNYAVALITIFAIITGYFHYRKNSFAVFIKQTLATLVILYCSYLVSAPVWNNMRRPPFYQMTVNGRNYIYNRSRAQYVAESYVVAIANAAVTVGMILVIEGGGGVRVIEPPTQPPQAGKKWLRRLQSCIGLLLICVFFSLLLSMLKFKRNHYPYNFLFE
ncbi:tumor suppressor candidate 3-like [Hyposmocoma kahamanoa]|uniref:tumor suppressor candidate 3-like n=1 Tax=Hyposmocoma kahamanoa TaxID=1477025 RepID=UPI000E6DA048|nr:tumor suppressor candidate 3-like [Hyposmocoma kahamanoa]